MVRMFPPCYLHYIVGIKHHQEYLKRLIMIIKKRNHNHKVELDVVSSSHSAC